MDLAALIPQIGLPLIAVVVPLAIGAFKKLIPSIPTMFLPIIAPVLGALLDLGLAYLASIPATGLAGALAGLAGVGVREIKDQATKALKGDA